MNPDKALRLTHVHVENFGVLHDFDMTFENGMNVLYEENGFGKSTLAAFIRVMFYGFDGDRKRAGASEREKFLPWQGGTFGGTLSFMADGKSYRIERYFGRRRADDLLRLYRADTGLECSDFGKNPGEALFGIDAESFERTAFIAQGGLRNEKDRVAPAVQAQIGDLSMEAADMRNYDDAMKKLEKAASSLSPNKSSGRIRKLKSELSSLDGTASRLEQVESAAQREADAIEKDTKSLQLLEERRKELTRRLTAASRSAQEYAQKAQYDSLVRQEKKAKADLARCRAYFPGPVPKISEIDRMIRLAGQIRLMQNGRGVSQTSAGRTPRTHVPAALSAVFLVLTAVLFITGHRALAVPVAAVFLATIAIWIVLILKSRHRAAPAQDYGLRSACRETDRFLESLRYRPFFGNNLYADTGVLSDSLLQVRDKCKEIRILSRAYSEAKKERQDFEQDHDLSFLRADPVREVPSGREPAEELDGLSKEMQQRQASSEESKRKLEELRLQVQECRKASERAGALRQQIRDLTGQYRILNLTAQYLRLSRETFTSQYRTPLMDSFTRYYGMIAGILPKDFEINADFDIEVREGGALRSSRSQSAGRGDLIALCRRMAIIDAMYRGRQPFVILDDPFVNFDDAKMEGALRFLEEIAQDRQVIYLTCQSARMP